MKWVVLCRFLSFSGRSGLLGFGSDNFDNFRTDLWERPPEVKTTRTHIQEGIMGIVIRTVVLSARCTAACSRRITDGNGETTSLGNRRS